MRPVRRARARLRRATRRPPEPARGCTALAREGHAFNPTEAQSCMAPTICRSSCCRS
ncbi:hypothetical protein BVI2075_360008 [Burkholderia vietnamiensis]|nr:hypothetical protein BVI2075_360008 [Burkholderia vietnamiensis]